MVIATSISLVNCKWNAPTIDVESMTRCEKTLSVQFARPVALRIESTLESGRGHDTAFVQMRVQPTEDLLQMRKVVVETAKACYPKPLDIVMEPLRQRR